MSKIELSLGIFAHNEEKNIDRLLKSVLKQSEEVVRIAELILISSGSHDKTDRILGKWQKKDKRIRVVIDATRKGKSSAVNRFIRMAKSDVLVTISGDLRLHAKALDELGIKFLLDEVGMVGARPKPSNAGRSDIGREIQILWELHHKISLIEPKCGEMVAFRNVVRQIPDESAVDEATLEVLLRMLGYQVVYAPRSVVYNKGPLSWAEFLTQRRRVFAGHQWVMEKYNHKVVTMNSNTIMRVVVLHVFTHPEDIKPMIRLIAMEVLARLLGWLDYRVFNKNPYVWRMIPR